MNGLTSRESGETFVGSVYEILKQKIIHSVYEPGERLNIETLAESLEVSATPVRECLNRLVAEDLLELVPRVGFFTKPILEGSVRELYELNFALLNWAIDLADNDLSVRNNAVNEPARPYLQVLSTTARQSPEMLASLSSKMFLNLALLSGNQELIARIGNINDRLYYIRKVEAGCAKRPDQYILVLCKAIAHQDYRATRTALVEYHNECLLVLRNVVKTLRMSTIPCR